MNYTKKKNEPTPRFICVWPELRAQIGSELCNIVVGDDFACSLGEKCQPEIVTLRENADQKQLSFSVAQRHLPGEWFEYIGFVQMEKKWKCQNGIFNESKSNTRHGCCSAAGRIVTIRDGVNVIVNYIQFRLFANCVPIDKST